jgi:hypothetical protein
MLPSSRHILLSFSYCFGDVLVYGIYLSTGLVVVVVVVVVVVAAAAAVVVVVVVVLRGNCSLSHPAPAAVRVFEV